MAEWAAIFGGSGAALVTGLFALFAVEKLSGTQFVELAQKIAHGHLSD